MKHIGALNNALDLHVYVLSRLFVKFRLMYLFMRFRISVHTQLQILNTLTASLINTVICYINLNFPINEQK